MEAPQHKLKAMGKQHDKEMGKVYAKAKRANNQESECGSCHSSSLLSRPYSPLFSIPQTGKRRRCHGSRNFEFLAVMLLPEVKNSAKATATKLNPLKSRQQKDEKAQKYQVRFFVPFTDSE